MNEGLPYIYEQYLHVSYSGDLKKQDVRLNNRNGGIILQQHTTYRKTISLSVEKRVYSSSGMAFSMSRSESAGMLNFPETLSFI